MSIILELQRGRGGLRRRFYLYRINVQQCNTSYNRSFFFRNWNPALPFHTIWQKKTYRNANSLDSDNAACIRKRFDFIDVHVKMYAVERLFWRSALENEFQSRNWPKTSGREGEGNAERDFSVDAGKTLIYKCVFVPVDYLKWFVIKCEENLKKRRV